MASTTLLSDSRLDDPDIEMEGLHFLEDKLSSIELTEDIDLSGHHLEKHDESLSVELISFNKRKYLIEHFLIIIKPILASNERRSRFSIFDIVRDILIKDLVRDIGKISNQYGIPLRKIIGPIEEEIEKIRMDEGYLHIVFLDQVLVIFFGDIECVGIMVSKDSF